MGGEIQQTGIGNAAIQTLINMEQKTIINAEEGKQDIQVIRQFQLPLALLFKAYETADLVEQWMGTKVLKLENKVHGSYRFETTDVMGNIHGFNGTIHEFKPDEKITRTFEMEGTNFPVQLEFLTFHGIDENNSLLKMHIVFKSIEDRDALLRMPFKFGINMAHDKIQQLFNP